uniref:metastasis-associated protein MTA1-like isoform X2 n=1 Tax=Myxine glutinosa TaxID=7769 RepID=UPI00358F3263
MDSLTSVIMVYNHQKGGCFCKELEEEMEILDDLSEKQRHQLKHRELFLSRQFESLAATHIRGKCSVTLLNETETLSSYLEKEDCFYYSLVYDPAQKTLLADKGEIRVGPRYQADVPDMLKEGFPDERDQAKLEHRVWIPDNPLGERQIDQFMVIARSVGTFARALDCTSSVRQPSLHMSAAAASRDITLFHAMDTLHRSGYEIARSIGLLVPQGGPVLCRDEMEEWSAAEANLFEEALEKYGKDFNDIRLDFLPWKSLTSIIEYYYMWKTTDRYVQQKRLKAAEAESKLKQVYIPNYNKPNPNQIFSKPGVANGAGSIGVSQVLGTGRACESCFATQSGQWYSWGPSTMQCRLCASCWTYWKKYGGLRLPTRLDGDRPVPGRANPTLSVQTVDGTLKCAVNGCGKEFRTQGHLYRHCQAVHGLTVRNQSASRIALKTRQAFYLHTTKLTRIARRLCHDVLHGRQAARRPFIPINTTAIKSEFPTLPGLHTSPNWLPVRDAASPSSAETIPPSRSQSTSLPERPSAETAWSTARLLEASKHPLKVKPVTRKPLEAVVKYLEANPCPNPKRPLPGLTARAVSGITPTKLSSVLNHSSPPILGKRGYDQQNGTEGSKNHSQAKSMAVGGRPYLVNGRPFVGSARFVAKGATPPVAKRRRLNCINAPDDVYFVASAETRRVRKLLSALEMKRSARRPYQNITPRSLHPMNSEPIVIED